MIFYLVYRVNTILEFNLNIKDLYYLIKHSQIFKYRKMKDTAGVSLSQRKTCLYSNSPASSNVMRRV